MEISIFGLGYVGVVTAGCLAARGHRIVGVDVNADKVDLINRGETPIIEKGVPELLKKALSKGILSATRDAGDAVVSTELSIICVGTPSRSNGSLNTTYLEHVCRDIGAALKQKSGTHILVFRSTMIPGTCRETIIPLLEETSGKTEGKHFFVAFNPEFLREATAVDDFNQPPKTVVGCAHPEALDRVMSLYEGLPGPMMRTSIDVAEMVKYVDNNFHALKITFGNEVGKVCKALGVDSYEVMDIFLQDTKLNISPAYLKPGFAFGGSCLPKDLRAMNYLAKMNDIDTPLLNALIPSNQGQILAALKRIMAFGRRRIGIAGFSFKAGTDDLRESPLVEVIEILLGKGYSLKIYDRNVSLSRLIGKNKDYVYEHIPHIASLMVDRLEDLLEDRELIIIGNKDAEFARLLTDSRDDQIIFDLVRLTEKPHERSNYTGLYW